MFKTNFSGQKKIWGALLPNATRCYGPASINDQVVHSAVRLKT